MKVSGLHFWFFLAKKPEFSCFLRAVGGGGWWIGPLGEVNSYLARRSPASPASGWADTSSGCPRGTSSSSGSSGRSSSSSAGLVLHSPVDEWSSADGSAGWDLIYPSVPPQKREAAAVSNRCICGNSGAAVTRRQQEQVCRPRCPYMLRCFHSSTVTRSFIHNMSGKCLLMLTQGREGGSGDEWNLDLGILILNVITAGTPWLTAFFLMQFI